MRIAMDKSAGDAFVEQCRDEQQRLREELAPYEAGTMRVSRGPLGGPWEEFTAERIETIKREIASLQVAIDFAVAQLGAKR
jgi:hypothetical protein